jgi:hypothetical protein
MHTITKNYRLVKYLACILPATIHIYEGICIFPNVFGKTGKNANKNGIFLKQENKLLFFG